MTGSVPGGPGGSIDWEEEAERLASRALAAGDATGWFEQLYTAGASGRVPVPWSRRDAHPLFVECAQRRTIRGEARRVVVVGAGRGPLVMITGVLVICNAIPRGGALQSIAGLIEGLWELSLSINCIVKGFRVTSPILRPDGITRPEPDSAMRHELSQPDP
jgi:hypothetical protein